ncbi:MAG: hypothetical protein ACTHN5_10045 [Phycisphaerae bacterium]
MNTASVNATLPTLNPRDPKSLDNFIRTITTDAREGPRAIANLLLSRPNNVPPELPLLLIPDLEDLSVIPLLELSEKKPAPAAQRFAISFATDGLLALRKRLVAHLFSLLDNPAEVPQPPMPGSEAQPLPLRICDQAYLSLRALLHPDENPADTTLAADAFLHLPDPSRDNHLKKLKSTHAFPTP